MPQPFHELTLEQFETMVDEFPWRRKITEVHVHHTFRPSHADFAARPGVQAIEGMFRFHTEERGFSDIAQHVTIDPRGRIWTGRNWNAAPASATGFNGNASAGPFMFEMIGNFDRGQDPWSGDQRDAAIRVIAKIQQRSGLPPSAFRFHNEMSSKTCPGSVIRRDDVLAAVTEAHAALGSRRAARADGVTADRAAVERMLRLLNVTPRGVGAGPGETELPEGDMTLRESEISAGARTPGESRAGDASPLTPEHHTLLRRHVINLRMGALSSGGTFQSTDQDVRAIFAEHLPRFQADALGQPQAPLKLVFFAHGGLNDEVESLRNARNRIPFYLANRCYPVFFIWETGVKETLVDIVRQIAGFGAGRAAGDAVTGVTDPVLEGAFRPAGFSMWVNMKRSAELAFMPRQGGDLLVRELAQFWKAHSTTLEIHAIGHSAGSIFLAHFIDALCQQPSNPPIEVRSLHFLAPAITVDLFKEKLVDLIGNRVKSLTQFTMARDFELVDAVGPYRKSLLYLVSRSFEDRSEMPILGLEESLRRDPDMTRFFGLLGAGRRRQADLFFSVREAGPRDSTIARKHGDFDNDRLTMNAVIRRIREIDDADDIIEFPETVSRSVLEDARATAAAPAAPPAAPMSVGPTTAAPSPAAAPIAAGGRRRALCVGIDRYERPNELAGCVNDATAWARILTDQLGFETNVITNEGASWEKLRAALAGLVDGARAGDALVFQYAGHGTRVADLDGDEKDGRDSALCPVDFTSGRLLIDDDVRAIFQRLPAGASLTCFFDCCHSGTITRMVAPKAVMPRGDVRRRGLRASAEVEAAHAAFRQSMRGAAPAPRGVSDMKEVSFTACSDVQTAQEVDGHGQFTVRALALLRQGPGAMTNADFHRQVTAAFGDMAVLQTPGLDCAPASALLPLLGGPVPAGDAPSPRLDLASRLDAIERRLAAAGI